MGPRTVALGAFARGPSPFCHLLPECSGFRQKRPPGAFPRLSGGKLSTDTKTVPQDAVGVEAVDRNRRPRRRWRPPAPRDGGLGGDCLSVATTSPVLYWRRLRVARLKFRLKIRSCRLLALSKRLAKVALRFSSCGLLPARRPGLTLLALRMALFDARRPSGRLTGRSCCSTCLMILRA